MQVIKRFTLIDYCRKHPETKAPLEVWFRSANSAQWQTMHDIQMAFPKATVLNGERVRFEMCAGNYQLVASFYFPWQAVWVKHLGTQKEYDQIDALTVEDF